MSDPPSTPEGALAVLREPEPSSILEGAIAILREPDPHAKAAMAERLAACCRTLPLRPSPAAASADDNPAARLLLLAVPDTPARPPLATTEPSRTGRRGNGGTAESRAKMLHALVHIESWAIDLAVDLVARFAAAAADDDNPSSPSSFYPRALAEDFCLVAADEARHFRLLEARLVQIHPQGYGAFAVHDGLWESAARTSLALPARLAVEHCVHEARGLDVLPATIAKFRAGGDDETADLLQNVVYGEEVAHCAAGLRWISWAHARAAGAGEKEAMRRAAAAAGPPVAWSSLFASSEAAQGAAGGEGDDDAAPENEDKDGSPARDQPLRRPPQHEEDWRADARAHASAAAWFRALVARHFHGGLKPPFNETARAKAGLTREWYWPDGGGAGDAAPPPPPAENDNDGGAAAAAAAAAPPPPHTPPERHAEKGVGQPEAGRIKGSTSSSITTEA